MAEKTFNIFFHHVSEAHPWEVLCLQEAFRRTKEFAPELGSDSDGSYTIFILTCCMGDYDAQPS